MLTLIIIIVDNAILLFPMVYPTALKDSSTYIMIRLYGFYVLFSNLFIWSG